MAEPHVSESLTILRDQGPMTLRDLTRATSIKMGWSLLHADIDAVMRGHLADGTARRDTNAGVDFRDNVWAAVLGDQDQPGQPGGEGS